MKYSSYTFLLIFLLLNFSFSVKGQKIRNPVVAGSYYPAEKEELKTQLASFFQKYYTGETEDNIAAVIAPHAGYVFSGEVAAAAYARINPDQTYSHIFLIGTSHHVLLNGASIYNQGNYSTPLGEVEVDKKLADKLIAEHSFFGFALQAHNREHSLEVQLPFLQYHLKNKFRIVPIIIGVNDENTCRKIGEALKPYFTPDNLFVISTDFSHYPSYTGAIQADRATGEAIVSNSPLKFMNARAKNEAKKIPGLVTSCCGWSSVLALLTFTSETPGTSVKDIKYANSGDTPYGDKDRVVGYHSFIVTLDESEANEGFSLSEEDKKQLLVIARGTIESVLKKKKMPIINPVNFSDNLKTPCGAFVTLNKNGRLRGCIGRFTASAPLYEVVRDMAVAAAFNDSRFKPVSENEIDDLDVEISVLTPLKKINDISEFELGKHGIYMIKGNRSGTFLPQVAQQTGWGKEEFLGHCARDKAGIGYDGWKNADLYTYEALVFDEQEILGREK